MSQTSHDFVEDGTSLRFPVEDASVHPGPGTASGAGGGRGTGAGALASVVDCSFGGRIRSRITGVYGSTRPPANPPPPTYSSASSPSKRASSSGSGPSSVPSRRKSITQSDGKPIERRRFATSRSSTCGFRRSPQTTRPSQSRQGRTSDDSPYSSANAPTPTRVFDPATTRSTSSI